MKIVKKLQIELMRKSIRRVVDVVQYDSGVRLEVEVVDFDLPAGTSAKMYVGKPSGEFVYQDGSVSGNVVSFDCYNQSFAECGNVPFQITLLNGSDVITSFTNIFAIEKSEVNENAFASKTMISPFNERLDEVIIAIAEASAKADAVVLKADEIEQKVLKYSQTTDDLIALRDSSISAVNAAKTTAVDAVQSAGATGTTAINTAKASALEEIEQNRTSIVDQIDTAKNDIQNLTTSGTSAINKAKDDALKAIGTGIDTTLTKDNHAADAGAVGRALQNLKDVTDKTSTALADLKMLGWSVPSESTVHNEVSGNQFIQNVGRVDLGDCDWIVSSAGKYYTEDIKDIKRIDNNYVPKLYCEKTMVPKPYIGASGNTRSNEAYLPNATRFVWCYDSDETNPSMFKKTLKGTYLYYELATPITMQIDGNEVVDKEKTKLEKVISLLSGFIYKEQIDSAEAYTKNVPVGAQKSAELRGIGGKSIKWNQMVKNGNFVDTSEWVSGLHTITAQDNTLKVNVTASPQKGLYQRGFSFKKGHKYFVKHDAKSDIDISDYRFGFGNYIGLKIEPISSAWKTISRISECSEDASNVDLYIYPTNTTVDSSKLPFNLYIKNVITIDLTAIFGSDAPTDVNDPRIKLIEQIAELKPEFDSGSLLNANVDDVVSVGKNLLDIKKWCEQAGAKYTEENGRFVVESINPLHVNTFQFAKEDTQITISLGEYEAGTSTNARVEVLDQSGTVNKILFLNADANRSFVATGSKVRCNYGSGGSAIFNKLQIEKGSNPTSYTPYFHKHHRFSNIVHKYFPDGMKSAGNVHDEIKFEKTLYRNMKSVDLGDLNWQKTSNIMYTTDLRNVSVGKSSVEIANILCDRYFADTGSNVTRAVNDKSMANVEGAALYIYDSAFTDVSSLKNSLKGTILFYEASDDSGEDMEFSLAIQKVGEVDLDSLDWAPSTSYSYGRVYYTSGIADINTDANYNLLCDKYETKGRNDTNPNNELYLNSVYKIKGDNRIGVVLPTGVTPETEMKNTKLHYELATPRVRQIIEDVSTTLQVESGGTITFDNENHYPIEVPNKEVWKIDISEVIKEIT